MVLKTWFWRPLSRITRSFHLLPPVAILIIFLLLITSGQVRELYLFYLEATPPLPIIFAFVTFALVSAAMFVSHFWLNPVQRDIVHANPAEVPGIAEYSGLRRFMACALAFLPWAGLAAGLWFARGKMNDLNETLAAMAQPFMSVTTAQGESVIRPTVDTISGALADLQTKALATVVLAVIVGALVTYLLDLVPRSTGRNTVFGRIWRKLMIAALYVGSLGRPDAFRKSVAYYRIPWRIREDKIVGLTCWVALFAALLIAAVSISPYLKQPIDFYRRLGPFATMAIGILFFYSIAALLAYLSREARWQSAGFPVLAVATIITVVCVYAGVPTATIALGGCIAALVLAILTIGLRLERPMTVLLCVMGVLAFCILRREHYLIAQNEPISVITGVSAVADKQNPQVRNSDLAEKFKTWLDSRGDKSKWAGRPYPAYIVAVESGGIYAATAAATLLARLQDRCPAFAQHVFAISAVSGGSIGATLFQSHLHSLKEQTQNSTCDAPQFANGPIERTMSKIILDDHFSPIVGSIVPDLIGQSWDRAQGLQQSLSQSITQHDKTAAEIINKPYEEDWSATGAAPALILNSTWAEQGLRVAYAPFVLSGEYPVYSFFDCKILGDGAAGTPLINAAVTSARFPGILPPFSVLRRTAKPAPDDPRGCPMPPSTATAATANDAVQDAPKRWNFVDGAYSDPIGAATALDILEVLESLNRTDVDLELILLTGSPPLPDYDSVNGTAFRDLIAPVSAVLNVRSQLANQSVERAVNYFRSRPGAPAVDDPETLPPHLKLIRLPDETFGLSLGWKISHVTLELVSAIIGRADICIDDGNTMLANAEQDIQQEKPAMSNERKRDLLDAIKFFNSNSCTLRNVEKTLTPP
jgi:hypothetical protein